MVTVCVGDDCSSNRTPWIYIKITSRTIESFIILNQYHLLRYNGCCSLTFCFIATTAFAAIKYFPPAMAPLLAPAERPQTDRAYFFTTCHLFFLKAPSKMRINRYYLFLSSAILSTIPARENSSRSFYVCSLICPISYAINCKPPDKRSDLFAFSPCGAGFTTMVHQCIFR